MQNLVSDAKSFLTSAALIVQFLADALCQCIDLCSVLSSLLLRTVRRIPVTSLLSQRESCSAEHFVLHVCICLRCSDAVDWATERASGLYNVLPQQCFLARGDSVVAACCLRVRSTVIVTEGMLPWSRGQGSSSRCSWPILAVWWQRAVHSKEHCHPQVLWCCRLGDRKGIRPVKVLPQQFPRVYFWRPA